MMISPSFNLNSSAAAHPFLVPDLVNDDYDHSITSLDVQESSSPSSHDIISFNTSQVQSPYPLRGTQQHQDDDQFELVDNISRFSHDQENESFKFPAAINLQVDGNGKKMGRSFPMKWMPSKMRNTDQTTAAAGRETLPYSSTTTNTSFKFEHHVNQSSTSEPFGSTDMNSNSCSNPQPPVRVCADCNTTKTPLWRSGPRGPKSLCNACGIRQRKARRAMAAAAAAKGAVISTEASEEIWSSTTKKDKLRIKVRASHCKSNKKRIKLAAAAAGSSSSSSYVNEKKKPCFEDFLTNLSKSLAFQQVFPQDEKEAAILLMALSCGLVLG